MVTTRRFFIILFVSLALTLAGHSAQATLSMDIDVNNLDFRIMDPGQTYELADKGTYHNEVSCSSTNNRTWYLYAQAIRPFTSGIRTIPIENFKWMVVSVGDGKGTLLNNVNIANPFTLTPGLIYTSDSLDNTGTVIRIRFRYVLTIPKNQVAGAYDSVVRFTMNEVL